MSTNETSRENLQNNPKKVWNRISYFVCNETHHIKGVVQMDNELIVFLSKHQGSVRQSWVISYWRYNDDITRKCCVTVKAVVMVTSPLTCCLHAGLTITPISVKMNLQNLFQAHMAGNINFGSCSNHTRGTIYIIELTFDLHIFIKPRTPFAILSLYTSWQVDQRFEDAEKYMIRSAHWSCKDHQRSWTSGRDVFEQLSKDHLPDLW